MINLFAYYKLDFSELVPLSSKKILWGHNCNTPWIFAILYSSDQCHLYSSCDSKLEVGRFHSHPIHKFEILISTKILHVKINFSTNTKFTHFFNLERFIDDFRMKFFFYSVLLTLVKGNCFEQKILFKYIFLINPI